MGYKPGFSNGLLVCLEHLDVVHVGLPVLDVAAVVGRQHPHVVVGPGHGTHWAVVGLREGKPQRDKECIRTQTNRTWVNRTQVYITQISGVHNRT